MLHRGSEMPSGQVEFGGVIKQGLMLGAATISFVCASFWCTFVLTLFGVWLLKWLLVPPLLQTFPVPLDFSPYQVLERRPGEYNLLEVRNPPLILRQARRPSGDDLGFDEDDIRFKSLGVPEAALGFTDLQLNVSGLLRESAQQSWFFFSRPRAMGYPLDVVLNFDYNALGFESAAPSFWLPSPPCPPVDFRVSLYSGGGLKIVETSASFFPEDQRAQVYETLRMTAVNLALSFLPLALRSLVIQTTSSFWQSGRVSFFDQIKFPPPQNLAPRLLKLRVSPKLPLRNVVLIIQAKAAAPIALLQQFPKLLPLTVAAICGLCAAFAACASSCILTALYLAKLTDPQQPIVRKHFARDGHLTTSDFRRERSQPAR